MPRFGLIGSGFVPLAAAFALPLSLLLTRSLAGGLARLTAAALVFLAQRRPAARSASAWLVVTASTPAPTTPTAARTGRVTRSTAVLAMQPDKMKATGRRKIARMINSVVGAGLRIAE
jgi:hypothetical protein